MTMIFLHIALLITAMRVAFWWVNTKYPKP